MTPHLPLDATHERIAELHAVAATTRASSSTVQPAGPGAVDRVRDAIGLRLIQLGGAVVSDGRRPQRLVRP